MVAHGWITSCGCIYLAQQPVIRSAQRGRFAPSVMSRIGRLVHKALDPDDEGRDYDERHNARESPLVDAGVHQDERDHH